MTISWLFGPSNKFIALSIMTEHKAQAKTLVKGGGQLRNHWKDPKGKIYEWDSQHGTVEVYDRSGRNYLGEFNHITGEQTKPADPTRKVEK